MDEKKKPILIVAAGNGEVTMSDATKSLIEKTTRGLVEKDGLEVVMVDSMENLPEDVKEQMGNGSLVIEPDVYQSTMPSAEDMVKMLEMSCPSVIGGDFVPPKTRTQRRAEERKMNKQKR